MTPWREGRVVYRKFQARRCEMTIDVVYCGVLKQPPPFDVKEHLTTWWLKGGYHLLTVLFLFFTIVYGWAAISPG